MNVNMWPACHLEVLLFLIPVLVYAKEIGRIRDPSVPREYCEFETFQPSCRKGEVIVMRSAIYGRMQIGRCVQESLGYLGCSADVLEAADRKCSGRQKCSVPIPDVNFNAKKQCNKELKMYLDASYNCQKVVEEDSGCTAFVASGPTSVALPSVSKFGCGSKTQPWVVEVVPGQRINVTVVDFFRDLESLTSADEKRTQPGAARAAVVDRAAGSNVTVWANGRDREAWVVQSKGNILEVYITQPPPETKNEEQYEFLLRFDAVGCADLRSTGDATITRDGNEVTVGCHATRQTWHLQCQGQRWTGVIGNCTSAQLTARKEAQVNSNMSNLPHALAIGTVAGVALTLCLLIVCIGFVVLRRFAKQDRLRDLAKAALQYDNVDSDEEIVQAYYTRTKPELRHPSTGTTGTSDPSTYSHVWELPLPDPIVIGDEIEETGGGRIGAPLGAYPGVAPGEDKQDGPGGQQSSPRTDQARYYVLDKGSTPGSAAAGAKSTPMGSTRC